MSRFPPASLWRIFRWPILIAVLSLIGLVGALLDDGWRDPLGAALLGVSAAAILWGRVFRRQ